MVQKSMRNAWSSVQFNMATFSGPISVHRKLSQVKFGFTIVGTFEALLIFLMWVTLSECALQRAILKVKPIILFGYNIGNWYPKAKIVSKMNQNIMSKVEFFL